MSGPFLCPQNMNSLIDFVEVVARSRDPPKAVKPRLGTNSRKRPALMSGPFLCPQNMNSLIDFVEVVVRNRDPPKAVKPRLGTNTKKGLL